MISRRVLRIKTMQLLYAYFSHKGETPLNKFEKDLYHSIQKSYDLYHLVLLIIIEIANYAEKRIDIARNKRLATNEDLNPNTRFIDNNVIQHIKNNNHFLKYITQNNISMVKHPELIKELYHKLIENKVYQEYLLSDKIRYSDSKNLVIELLVEILANCDSFYEMLEEESIYWNDEIEFIISAVIKTIKGFKGNNDENTPLMPLFKNEDDQEFSKRLFRKAVLNHKEYEGIIEKFCINWEFDRIAFMDILIMTMGIAELIEFPSIPTRVTFNEYIELSKYYSTPKSNMFINGILDKVFSHLKDTNKFAKQGRGLIGE